LEKVCFNGGLRSKNKRGISLTVYSTPFARFLLKNNIGKISLFFEEGSFAIRRGNNRKVTIERQNKNQPLCVFSVTKLVPAALKKRLVDSGKQSRVEVRVEGFASKKELRKHNNLINSVLPSKGMRPIKENEKIEVGCSIVCFRTKNSSSYRFSVRHRILEEIANKNEKISLGRDESSNFIIRKSPEGKKFNLYKYPNGRPVTYLQISPEFLTEEEKELFGRGKRSISYRAFLSGKEFRLDISKFFATKEERGLAYALIDKGMEIRIPKMRERQGDIILRNSSAQIEVTNLMPGKGANKNNAHGEGIHINGRLCEGFLRVKKKETPLFFVVFNEKWLEHKWIGNLTRQVKPEVIAITTDFKGRWAEKVSNEIIKHVEKVFDCD
jgi:hypothetical protein